MTKSAKLRAQAAKCRRLAAAINDDRTALALTEMAERYEADAAAAEGAKAPHSPSQMVEAYADPVSRPDQPSAGMA